MTADLALRLLFVYRRRWESVVKAVASGEAPAEAHGLFWLLEQGFDARGVDESLEAGRFWGGLSYAYQRLYAIPRTSLGYRLHQARAVRDYLGEDAARWVVATFDSVGLPLLALKARGALPNPLAYVSVGLSGRIVSGRVSKALARRYRALLREADVILAFAPSEVELLEEWAPGAVVRLWPLGVDVGWWTPPRGLEAREGTVVSPGRDPSRSFATLVAAVDGLPLETTIVGSLAREQGIRGGDRLTVVDDVPIAELRRRFWSASLVAVPSRKALHGAGQASALQAMAARKPVILSDTGWAAAQGLHQREHFVDVPAEDPVALRDAIVGLVEHPEEAAAMAARAHDFVTERFSPAAQGQVLLDALRGSRAT